MSRLDSEGVCWGNLLGNRCRTETEDHNFSKLKKDLKEPLNTSDPTMWSYNDFVADPESVILILTSSPEM